MKHIAVGFGCDNACVFCAQGSLRTTAPEGGDGVDGSAAQSVDDRLGGSAARSVDDRLDGSAAQSVDDRLDGSAARSVDDRLDGSAARSVEDSIAAIGAGEAVAFVGGEPGIHERLEAWIEGAVGRGASRIVVQTNGRKVGDRDRVRRLAAAANGRLSFDVSLHGATAAMHDYHTQIGGSFVETVRGIRALKTAGLRFGVTVVVTRSNFRHLVEIAALVAELGAEAIHFAGVEPFGSALENEARVVPAAELVTPHLAAAATLARKAGLGVVAASVAEPASARAFFAGIGEVEQPASAPKPERARLPILGRPEPGRSEQRGSPKQSGDALRAIFPELFDAAAGDANLRAGRG